MEINRTIIHITNDKRLRGEQPPHCQFEPGSKKVEQMNFCDPFRFYVHEPQADINTESQRKYYSSADWTIRARCGYRTTYEYLDGFW